MMRALNMHPRLPRGRTKRGLWLPGAALAIGLALTGLVAHDAKKHAEAQDKQEFAFACDETRLKISERMHAYRQILRSGAALFDASDDVTREKWRGFVASLRTDHHYPGIQGMGYALLIPRQQLARHVRDIRRQGFPEYQVKPAGERPVYTSIIYLEPFTGRNLRAFGYDMFSEPVRRSAMEGARDRDTATISGKVILVQETGEEVQAGILMYVPVYRKGMPIATVAQRRAALQGWVYSPYRMNDLIRGMLGSWRPYGGQRLRLQIYEGGAVAAETLLYDSDATAGAKPAADSHLVSHLPLDVAGNRWTLRFTKTGGGMFAAYGAAWAIGAGGTVISLLLVALLFYLLNTRFIAQQLAGRLTGELERKNEDLSSTVENLQAAEQELRAADEELRDQYEELEKREQRYRSTLDCMIEGCQIIGHDWRYLYINDAAERHNRRPRQELLGNAYQDMWPGITTTEAYGHIRRCLEERVPQAMESEFVFPDGGRGWFELSIQPVPEGVFIRSSDITEQKRVEQELQASETRYRALFDSSPDGILIAGCESKRIRYANPAACRMLGYAPEELTAMGVADLSPADHLPRATGEFEAMARGEKTAAHDIPCRRKDGTVISTDINAVVTVIDGIRCNVGFFRDITERKHLEEQFMQSQRLESLGTLAGGIAHDLNNVLAPILLAVDMLKAVVTDPRGLHIVDNMEKCAERGSQIIKQILGFARGTGGMPAVFQPRHVIQETISLARETFPKSISVRVVMPGDLWPIRGDATQFHQALMNLAVNARDAMPRGGTLTVAAENCVLDEGCARARVEGKSGRYVSVSIRDTGAGMTPEIRQRIFDPFFTTKGPGKGTGLGLSTVHAIAQRHGGFINMHSEEGKGTTFKIYIPAADEDLEPAAPAGTELIKGGGSLVLVVDDDEAVLSIVKLTLEAFGYRTLAARDGAEAVAVYQTKGGEIDLVLIDNAMPNMDGATAIQAIRALNPTARIILSSGLIDADTDEGGGKATADAYVSKPYTAEKLLHAIHQVLRGQNAQGGLPA